MHCTHTLTYDHAQEHQAQRGPHQKNYFCTYTFKILIELSKFYRHNSTIDNTSAKNHSNPQDSLIKSKSLIFTCAELCPTFPVPDHIDMCSSSRMYVHVTCMMNQRASQTSQWVGAWPAPYVIQQEIHRNESNQTHKLNFLYARTRVVPTIYCHVRSSHLILSPPMEAVLSAKNVIRSRKKMTMIN